jgi:hypothetical protein
LNAAGRRPAWIPVAVAGAVAVALVRTFVEPSRVALRVGGRSLPTVCPVRLLTGRPCPSCGMARGVALLCHGRVREAREVNAASPLGAAVLLVALVRHGVRAQPSGQGARAQPSGRDARSQVTGRVARSQVTGRGGP